MNTENIQKDNNETTDTNNIIKQKYTRILDEIIMSRFKYFKIVDKKDELIEPITCGIEITKDIKMIVDNMSNAEMQINELTMLKNVII